MHNSHSGLKQFASRLDDDCLATFKVNDQDCYILPKEFCHADPRIKSKITGYLLLGEFKLNGNHYRIFTKNRQKDAHDIQHEHGLCSDAITSLTERELQIAVLVAKGFLNKQIAENLSLSIYTVQTHIKRIFIKCCVHNRTALAAKIKNL